MSSEEVSSASGAFASAVYMKEDSDFEKEREKNAAWEYKSLTGRCNWETSKLNSNAQKVSKPVKQIKWKNAPGLL